MAMNDSENARFRALIAARLSDLDEQDNIGRDSQSTVELDQQAIGRLSRQDALLSQSMARATQARRDALRKGLSAALARIDSGDFGYCDDCGEDIAVKRLELDPTAQRCISCARG